MIILFSSRLGRWKVFLQHSEGGRQCSICHRGWAGNWYLITPGFVVTRRKYFSEIYFLFSGVSQLGDGILPSHWPGSQTCSSCHHREHQQHHEEPGPVRGQRQEARDGGVHRSWPHHIWPRPALQETPVIQSWVETQWPILIIGMNHIILLTTSWSSHAAGLVHTRSDVRAGWVLCEVRSAGMLQTPLLPRGSAGEVWETCCDRPHADPLQLRLLRQPRARKQVSHVSTSIFRKQNYLGLSCYISIF